MLPRWVSVCVWRGGGLLADRVTNGAFKPVKESVHHCRKTGGRKTKTKKTKKNMPPLCKTRSHATAELISSINKNPISNKHPQRQPAPFNERKKAAPEQRQRTPPQPEGAAARARVGVALRPAHLSRLSPNAQTQITEI